LANLCLLGDVFPKDLAEKFPNKGPVAKFNSFVLGYLAIEILVRQFMQKLPTVSFKPLLLLNIRRRKIVNYLMLRSILNFFNVLPFFLLIPFSIRLVAGNYSGMALAGWIFALSILVLSNHFLAIYLKWRFNEAEYGFFVLLGALAALFALNHYGIVNFSGGMGKLLDLVLAHPAVSLLLLIIPVIIYFLNIRFLLSQMFINMVATRRKEEKISDYSWLDRLGENGRFIALELKLIWRNKRPRSVAMMTLMMLFYGLLVYKGDHGNEPPLFIFIIGGIIIVGMFSIAYGQFFPAWHSNYFSMLMCQRLTMKQFLRSFYILVTVVSVSCYILSLPYALMYPKIIYTHLAMLLYNLSITIHTLFFTCLFRPKSNFHIFYH